MEQEKIVGEPNHNGTVQERKTVQEIVQKTPEPQQVKRVPLSNKPITRRITKLESTFIDLLLVLMSRGEGLTIMWSKSEKCFLYWIDGINEDEWNEINRKFSGIIKREKELELEKVEVK
jgi:hypothetical protein